MTFGVLIGVLLAGIVLGIGLTIGGWYAYKGLWRDQRTVGMAVVNPDTGTFRIEHPKPSSEGGFPTATIDAPGDGKMMVPLVGQARYNANKAWYVVCESNGRPYVHEPPDEAPWDPDGDETKAEYSQRTFSGQKMWEYAQSDLGQRIKGGGSGKLYRFLVYTLMVASVGVLIEVLNVAGVIGGP